ncbi:auxin-induced protein 6B-like [Phalaenopsis equestris]|uniref:auxin-induced protein 6B-like n=1 Tax=Phalaenopsis equestris TaxID=78828 RepID=UPI0009E63494|nr:auxin-induced protein 6B-like [Phalaenopsis equestris]
MGMRSNIRHNVRLRQMLSRLRIRAMGLSPPSRPAIDVPAGHIAVYVGSMGRRFVIRVKHLNHPAFRNLLHQVEKEYGFHQPGPLSLPCDETAFLQVLRQISSSYAFRFASANNFDFAASGSCYFRRAGRRSPRRGDAIPLLRGYAEDQVW